MTTRIANPDIIQLGALYGGIDDVAASNSPSTTQPTSPLNLTDDMKKGIGIGLVAGMVVGFIVNKYIRR